MIHGQLLETWAPMPPLRMPPADDADFRMIMRNYRAHSRYETRTVANGGEVLRPASASLPELIITDLQMPVLKGMEASRWRLLPTRRWSSARYVRTVA